jgi:hypothetical protein
VTTTTETGCYRARVECRNYGPVLGPLRDTREAARQDVVLLEIGNAHAGAVGAVQEVPTARSLADLHLADYLASPTGARWWLAVLQTTDPRPGFILWRTDPGSSPAPSKVARHLLVDHRATDAEGLALAIREAAAGAGVLIW